MKDYNRRDLFKQFGASALLLYPILSSRSQAADAAVKKRMVVVLSSSGVIQTAFWPTGIPGTYSFKGTSLEPLTALMSNLTVAKGAYNDWNGGDSHSAGAVSLLTGNRLDSSASTNGRTDVIPGNKFAYNASIDQLVAAQTKGQTPIDSLVLGVQPTGDRPSKYISYAANGTYVPQSTNPYTVFNAIFQPLVASCTGTGQSQTQAVAGLLARRKSILDAITGDLNDATRLAGLGASEKAKIDAYAASIQQLEKTLQAAPVSAASLACTTLSPFTSQAKIDVNNQNYALVERLMLDLIIAAFQLDVTRVATMVWDVGGNNGVPSTWVKYNGNPIGEGYHDLSHNTDDQSRQKSMLIDAYHATEFAYLLSQLRASPEGGGSILDNSLAMWSSELGDGAAHSGYNIPVVIGGSAGGAFKTGRYVQLANNPSHHGVLLAMIQAMGIQTNSVGRSGNINPLL